MYNKLRPALKQRDPYFIENFTNGKDQKSNTG